METQPEYIVPDEVQQLRKQARHFRKRAKVLEEQAFEAQQEQVIQAMREANDRLLNKKQALELLPVGSYQSLLNYQERYGKHGYLQFNNGKIMRSELLRFLDDFQSGNITL